MINNKTTEFSFILKPSHYGIGVFATHGIKSGTHLRLFGDKETINLRSMSRPKEEVPEVFRNYCMDRGNELICPLDFGQMPVGWYLNHSKNPNAVPDNDYRWYAARDIASGEEVTIDYNSLNEPEEAKENFYKN